MSQDIPISALVSLDPKTPLAGLSAATGSPPLAPNLPLLNPVRCGGDDIETRVAATTIHQQGDAFTS